MNHPLVGLVFTTAYLFFLSVKVAYIPYSTSSNLIAMYTFLLLRYLLLDRVGYFFNKDIMLFVLISRILIDVFLLLSLTITFYGLFGKISCIKGRF